ncbi:cytochrome c family protein [gamma proteobacterium HTCC5015]|nr:cytochrome c family protein [gamma proteobacterium HTCC5015]
MRLLQLFLLSALVFSNSAFAAGDPAQGRKSAETCVGCHAVKGYFNVYPSYKVPKLAGQHAAYIEAALKAYRDGTRQHETMQANAANLSDQEIADIAAYFESQQYEKTPSNPPVNADLAAKGKELSGTCVACHGADGNSASNAFPTIAGQHKSYIINSLHAYKDGRRDNAVMAGMAAGLDEEAIEALAAWYSSQKGLNTLKLEDENAQN